MKTKLTAIIAVAAVALLSGCATSFTPTPESCETNEYFENGKCIKYPNKVGIVTAVKCIHKSTKTFECVQQRVHITLENGTKIIADQDMYMKNGYQKGDKIELSVD